MAPLPKKLPWLDGQLLSLFDRFASTAITKGHLTLVLPDGSEREYGDPATTQSAVPNAASWVEMPPMRARIVVHNGDLFYKVVTRHDTGLGEAFMHGDFSVDNLGAFMAVMTANAINMQASRGILGVLNWWGDKLLYLAHLTRANTVEGSKKNISEHYDAGNDMYKLFLDETLTYSAGIHHEGESLEQAQLNKLDALIKAANVTADSHVLEVGCGWGSCAIRAVQTTGCRWTGITVSIEQLIEAQARVAAAGLGDRVTLLFCDYRDVPARYGAAAFDAVVSCEMIEAVGHEHLPLYFDVVGSCLKPGGLFAMQVITMPDGRYAEYANASDFIREHIFPGGHLPSMGAMTASAAVAGLAAVGARDIGPHYAITLREWRKAWITKWADIQALGYSDTFMRKWEFYFAYCEAAFDASYIQDYQITWQRVATPAAAGPSAVQAPAVQALVAGATAGMAPGRSTTKLAAAFSMATLSESRVTCALFALYCLLAGAVLARQPRMWIALLTFATGQTLPRVARYVSAITVPDFAIKGSLEQASWAVDVADVSFSLVLGLPALCMLLSSQTWVAALQLHDSAAAPSFLVCAATGMWASQLAVHVQSKLFLDRPGAVLHLVMLLAVFSASAFKQEHTGLLAMTLPAQLCFVPDVIRKLMALHGKPEPPALHLCQLAMDLCFRHLLHAIIFVLVLAMPHIWSSPVYYLLATNGMLYVNWVNVLALLATSQGAWVKKAARAMLAQSPVLAKAHVA